MTISNRDLAELFARRADEEEPRSQRQRAARRAARAALLWEDEAAAIVTSGGELSDLAQVGPWSARLIAEWLAGNEPPPAPPPLRAGFRTLAEARRRLASTPHRPPRCDLQMHTTWTDGHSSLREMAAACVARGYSHVAITDHTGGLKIAGGMDEGRFAEQRAEVADVEAETRVLGTPLRILRSCEVNLSPEGDADMSDSFLDSCDIVLGAFHSKLRLGEDQTARYLAAIDNPHIDILGHPRCRIWNFRSGLQCDWRAVMDRAADLDVALECDAYADRQDLDVELLKIAASAGVRVSLGSDAHHVVDLSSIDLGVAAALEAGVPPDRLLNLMSTDELSAWARSRGRGRDDS